MKNNTAIILLLLSVGLFYTFTNPQYRDVRELGALASQYRNVLENVSAITELRDRLVGSYGTFPREEITRINKVLPDDIDTVRLAFDLDVLASRYGVSIKDVHTSIAGNENAEMIVLPEFAGPYDVATVSFSFVSNYNNFMLLLSDIERSLRIMDIKTIAFQTNESGLYEYKVTVDTYWLK